MENGKFNAAVAADFLEKVSQCFYQEYDDIYDLNFTEDNFDIEKLLFHCFSSSYKISFSYEQLSLLRSLLLLLCSNNNLLMYKNEFKSLFGNAQLTREQRRRWA